MNGPAVRILPYLLAFFSSLVIMILELVASRLVARHVGASLDVWTSVIGIMLGGICLGNVLGGRLADRSQPLRVIGPLYALATALTLGCLWINALGGLIPVEGVPTWVRTISLVTIDFLIPGTVLGMIGPVVAKLAVEQAHKSGSAIGDVYTLGAVGSIAGTFLAGYQLMYLASTTTIITLVAAALALLATMMLGGDRVGRVLGLLTAAFLALGSIGPVVRSVPVPGVVVGGIAINPLALVGHVLALMLAAIGVVRLVQAKLPPEAPDEADLSGMELSHRPKLGDLAALSFLISLAFMAFEMAAGRLVSRHLGSSIYGWTSVIGVLLGGLSLGNFLGGKLADFIKREKQASWLFLAASALLLSVLFLESPPRWLVSNPIGYFFKDEPREPLISGGGSLLSTAITMTGRSWGVRVFLVTFVAFFLPSVALGTVSPVMAKLAIERVRRTKRTGGAIGAVYAWGMVGSILGTFLTGFLLIDVLGTKGVILLVATLMALAATVLGTTWHAVWAGIPLGMCVIAYMPGPLFPEQQGRRLNWFQNAINSIPKQGQAWGLREATFDPDTNEEDGLAWIDESNYYYIKVENSQDAEGKKRTLVLDNLIHGYFILDHPERLDYDYEHIYALVSDRVAKAKKRARLAKDPAAKDPTAINTMFLGGGAYTFQRYIQHTYPGSVAEVAEIDPAVTRANHAALGLPKDTPIKTTWGDARQFVERNQGKKQFDIVFGDAFNDFSVPWHLTTREFNDKLATMMDPDGVYMINIIDVYESDAKAEEKARKEVAAMKNPPANAMETALAREKAKALRYGGFLGSWIETARKTFDHIYVFGTDSTPGSGLRETFVVVASRKPLDLDILGGRDDDPRFFQDDQLLEPKPYSKEDMDAIKARSRGIILTDDYAPVENLLAPVAETRGDD
ncbi:fused MFS/spermidine synthase [Tundrisphaera sp. TA3]|uniref:fused MFS/spermidine synthase n=1 Tax=Tundrisphaera sp. TA3 TaxID=3435775 RepID=UPI003EBAC5AE